MTRISAERIAAIEGRKEDLSNAMSAPDLAPEAFVQLSKDYAEILPVAEASGLVRRKSTGTALVVIAAPAVRRKPS